MGNTLDDLIKELLKFSDDNRDSVKEKPKNETERGFQLATIILCTKLRRITYSYTDKIGDTKSYTVDEFHKILDELDK